MRTSNRHLAAVLLALTVSLTAHAGDKQHGNSERDDQKDAPGKDWALFENLADGKRIVFVISANGNAINHMWTIKEGMKRAVDGLTTQAFNVAFFQDIKVEPFRKSIAKGSDADRKKFAAYLEGVTATGSGSPDAAIEWAFKQHPDTIYLLTTASFPDNDATVAQVRSLNKDKKVKVNTIGLELDRGSKDAAIEALKKIASENGGKYKEASDIPRS